MATVDELRAQRAALDAQIKEAKRAERLAGKAPPWGPEGAALYRAVGEAIRSTRLAKLLEVPSDGRRF